MEFKSFNKIAHIGKLWMSITEKIHGSNAVIGIERQPFDMWRIQAGSRTKWLTPDDDNYGFCKWVMANKEELVSKLGEGRHYGEWFGAGINSNYGLKDKHLALFNWRRFEGKELPANVTTVPVLYRGAISLDAINGAMEQLKSHGSSMVKGFMRPEGIVIDLDGQLYKNVFDAEETKWTEKTKRLDKTPDIDISHLFQPIRLEKLLSRDESYSRDYPTSLGRICSDYVKDLEEEGQFKTDPDEMKAEKKALGREIFFFVKSMMGSIKCA